MLGRTWYFLHTGILEIISYHPHSSLNKIIYQMMNIILFVEKQICGYVPIAHNSIKTLISQPDMTIKWQRLSPMKCCAFI